MKSTKILSIVFLLASFLTSKADEYPWEKYGFKFKVVTLSNGKYQEFHDLKDVVEIGSVLFNTQTNQIVGFVEKDTLFFEGDMSPHLVSRWISPDPLSDEYSSWSPYAYTLNNPIKFIDPDGREPRWGQLGTLSQISTEMTNAAGAGTYSQQMNALGAHFSGNRLFTRVNGQLQDAPGSVNVKRYLYTERAGWVDMEHFFAFASHASSKGIMAASLLAYGTEEAQGTKLPGWDRTASAYSYEDIQSDFSGIDFWLKFGEGIENGDVNLTDAVNQYLQSLNPTDPSEAPNIDYIPHTVNGKFTPKNMGNGWTGDKLGSEHKKVYDRRSEEDKKRIEDAHNTIKD